MVTDGSISFRAGNNVTVASGAVGTAGGGDINIIALGSVSAGNGNLPGQIGTVDGGSISISAGEDISGNIIPDGGVVVTNITAGGSITNLPGDHTVCPIKGCSHGNVCPHDGRHFGHHQTSPRTIRVQTRHISRHPARTGL